MSTPAQRCHDCQHLATNGGRSAYCSKKHKIAYEYPADSTVTDFGFRAVLKNCARSFVPRDSSYYLAPAVHSEKRAANGKGQQAREVRE